MSVLRYSCLLLMSGVAGGLRAAELPIPCIAGSCGTAVPGFVSAGLAQAVQAGNTLTIEQLTDSATLNWQSFNISADGKVTFKQPDAASVALNRIFQADASRIFGSLTANGRIFLVNQNGIVFGEGAQVNAAGLIASSLDMTPAAIERGIAQAAQAGQPAFRAFTDADGNASGGAVRVERGATIESAGGQVLLFALSQVENRGTIRTPDGQTILAAGDTVFLATSADPNLRGLLVEVGNGGTVTNGLTNSSPSTAPEQLVGNIIAERGNITLAGLAVNQLGRVSATTSVRANGSIHLIARDQAEVATGDGFQLVPGRGGDLVLGAGSHTAVTLDLADTATAIDATAQPRSMVRLDGHNVSVLAGSEIIANAGTIDVTARARPSIAPTAFTSQSDGSRIRIADDVLLDVSGARVDLPVERNVLRVELRGNQLRDSPAQRDGPLRGEAVFVDIRRTGTRADGSTWVGTPLADLSGDVSTITRGVGERNLAGGSILLQSQGDTLVAGGARLDVSGGRINYANGFINTTRLLAADGTSVDIGLADPERAYIGILDTSSQVNRRWGITENYTVNGFDSRGAFEQGYVEGKDAGSVTLSAPQLIFDGAISGQTVRGPHQRTPGASLSAGAFRPFDQVPFGASLMVGNATPEVADLPDNVVGGIRVDSGRLLGTLRNETGGLFDLLQDSLSAEETTFRLRPELLGAGAFTRVSLFANDTIEIPAGVALDLGQGGSFSATAGRVLSAGVLSMPGGTVALEARPGVAVATGETLLQLSPGARIEVQGGWVNDNPLLGTGRDALFTSGGMVSLSAKQGELLLESGSAIDVSGGAQRRADGRIVAGRGGSLSLDTSPALDGTPFVPTLAADISAFSFSRGGQLSITAPALCISATNCASEDVSMLWLSPRLFAEHGFADFRLRSNLGGITVSPGTELLISQLNRLPGQGIASLASSDNAASAARIGVLPTQEQLATSINMNAQIAVLNSPLSAADFAETPALTIGAGAMVQTQARGQISLNANSRVAIDGLLAAPAGRIDIGLDAGLRIQEFLPSQTIWFGDHAHLSAAGLARVYLDALGNRRGEVLPGGAITINAQRGYVLGQPGSLFDVSGTSATLDLRRVAGGVTGLAPQVVNSAGGDVSITAAEGVLWSGKFAAQGGSTAVPGGQLTVTLDANLRNDPGLFAPAFLTGARRVELTPTVAPIVIAAGANVPATFNGRALLSTAAIEASGFDSVVLAAGDINASAFFGGTLGQIGLNDASLTLRRALTLDASVITGQGVNRLSAPYVSIGHSDALRQLSLQTLAPGNAQLRVDADHIDLIGAISLDGFDALYLDSSGDIRLRGVQRPLERRYAGSLLTNASLTLEAAQIYPATLTDYAIRVTNNTEGAVTILTGASDQRAPVLSVGGSLSVDAPSIRQAGFLRAPLGSITLAGEDVVLARGSHTSTSLEGATALFGSTQAGLDWVYELPDRQTLVFGPDGDALPAQRVELDGTRVSVDAGATVNLAGGGDLLAYEFVPGVGGSRDLLANDVRPDQFAIVPSLGTSFGPFDTREFQGTNLSPGDTVYLAGTEGLAAGFYTLLPARYALLPGAFLVTQVSGYQDINVSESFGRLDGSTVVAGFRSFSNTGLGDSRTSGFAIRPGTAIQKEARYDVAGANEFFTERSRELEVAIPRLPLDAGQLVLSGIERLELNGELRANAAPGGRGAEVDIAGSALRVVADASQTPADPTALVLDAGDISRLGAESVLLGGVRRRTAEGSEINVRSTRVSIDAGATLTAPELTLVASDRISLASGATIASLGTVASRENETLAVSGDGALLRVSTGERTELARTDESGLGGTLDLAAGSVLRSAGSALLDASFDTRSAATLDMAGASLQFGARRISLSNTPLAGEAGLVLDPRQLSTLGLRELALTSRSTIDLAPGVNLSVQELSLNAAGIRRAGTSPGDARLAANVIEISNDAGTAIIGPPGGNGGALALDTGELRLGDGRFDIFDFGATTVTATDRWFGTGAGELATAGDLSIFTPLVTQSSNNDGSIAAGGRLSLGSTGSVGGTSATQEGIGAGLTLTGRSVHIDTAVALPSGRLEVAAIDEVSLGSGAHLQLAGITRDFDGSLVGSPGGDVLLDARQGNLSVAAGARIDVSGAGSSDAGRITASAISGTAVMDGTFSAAHAAGASGGEFLLDAWLLPNLDSFNSSLNTGGFTARRSLRQRGPGDLVLGAGAQSELRAHEVDLFADQGGVRIAGLIDAAFAPGGQVRIGARDDVNISGRIEAVSGSEAGSNARISVRSEAGRILLAREGVIRAEGGDISLQLPRSGLTTLTDGIAGNDALVLAGVTTAREVTLEGFQRYDAPADGFIPSAFTIADASNPLFADAAAFMQDAAAMRSALGRFDDATFRIVPGIELVADGNLTLIEDWNLYGWRFDGAPGVLTLRAGGDLNFAASLSDGFSGTTGNQAFVLPSVVGPSWSYRLVGGADLASSDPLAVQSLAQLGETGGNVLIDPGFSSFRMVRTGTGSIDVAAARDFVLGDNFSVLYTAGTAGPGVPLTARAGGLGGRTYPIDGGDISLHAGRDVVGATSNQMVTDWLWRSGRPAGLANPSATGWTVNFSRFMQGLGALAGGRVDVSAGRDVLNLSASVPTIGRQVGGTAPASSRVEVIGGGRLQVDAGRNVVDGKFFVGGGELVLRAGDSIMNDSAMPEVSAGTLIALGDAHVSALARRNLLIGSILNPTLLPQGISQNVSPGSSSSVFSTYGANSAARLFAVGGELSLLNDTGLLAQQLLGSMSFDDFIGVSLRVYPPSLSAVAFDGDVSLLGSFALYPDAAGQFALLANNDITMLGSSAVEVLMSNADPSLLPTVAAPQAGFGLFAAAQLETAINISPDFNARIPVHAGTSSVAHVVARLGDIAIESGGSEDASGFYFPMPARFSAGRDIRDLSLTVIHPGELDTTTLNAGRDLRYTIERGERGGINRSQREINVDGGGRLEITAGRDVDLQTSSGISTRGDIIVPGVAEQGAAVRVLAGLQGKDPAWQAFSDRYLRDGSVHDAALLAYVTRESGSTPESKSAALAAFAQLSEARRRPLLEEVFFAELRITGRIAAPLGDRGDFARAYAALTTLFPGSNPDLAAGQTNAYDGDIRLYFSRIYSLDGGDISLLAPGGGINAGLATPPVAFGIDKSPSQLGIVAQSIGNISIAAFGDTQVNESRIFAADGGNIMIWATRGDIDAGRGAKTAISAPAPSISFDANGRPTVLFPAALAGSGIQSLATSPGRRPGDVDLFAPRGVVNAGDAGIVAGNLTIAATAVLGANNIQVSGVSVGVPVDAGGLAAGLQGVSNVASSSSNSATALLERGADTKNDTPLASAALGWLEVFVEGFGEDVCKPDDVECLARQRTR